MLKIFKILAWTAAFPIVRFCTLFYYAIAYFTAWHKYGQATMLFDFAKRYDHALYLDSYWGILYWGTFVFVLFAPWLKELPDYFDNIKARRAYKQMMEEAAARDKAEAGRA